MSLPSFIRAQSKTIFIIPSIDDDFGASEIIWYEAVPHFQKAGYRVIVLKRRINRKHERFQSLAERGVQLLDFDGRGPEVEEGLEGSSETFWEDLYPKLKHWLGVHKPSIVLINQGTNFDGLVYALTALRQGIPYAIISHKAVEYFWPWHKERTYMKEVWSHSQCNWFVSDHNRRLTQEQFGMDIPRAKLLFNPIRTFPNPLPYPSTDEGFRLACIGRLYLFDKGQDILMRILDRPEWRERPLHVDFIGSGVDEGALRDFAAFLGLPNVGFLGYVEQDRLWGQYHALVLPSRHEGLPLVVQEAMASGRTVIAGNAGGTGELIRDGVNGFLGEPYLKDFSDTMDRAWERRSDWEAMGRQAFQDFHAFHPGDAVKVFADEALSYARSSATAT